MHDVMLVACRTRLLKNQQQEGNYNPLRRRDDQRRCTEPLASRAAARCWTAAATLENSSRTGGSTLVSFSASRCTPRLFCSAGGDSLEAKTHDSLKLASATLPTQGARVRATTSAARLSICTNRSSRLMTYGRRSGPRA